MRDKILEMVRQSAEREKPYGWLNYQPINLPGYEETIPLRGRDCFDRAAAVFGHIARTLGEGPLSLLDSGCNLGFFVFEAAKRGHLAQGFDSDRRLIEACNFLAADGSFPSRPSFLLKTLSADAVRAAPPVDVILCFSVIHHLPEKERFQVLDAIAGRCKSAYIEMDGPHQGRKALELFFWRVEQVAETNDRYGNGRLKRKTFFCTNQEGGRVFRNMKTQDFVFDRGLFLCSRPSAPPTVLKRDRAPPGKYSHTWLKTSVVHERDIYRRHASPFFPVLLASGEDDFRWIELEFVERRGVLRREAVDELYDFLEQSKLFLVDFRRDSFIPCDGRLRMIDLESLFPLEGTVAQTIPHYAQDLKRLPPHLDRYDSYQKQRTFLKHAFYGTSS